MTDARIIAVAITVVAVMVGSLFNKARISRLSASVNRRIDDLKEVFHAELRADTAEVRANAGKLEWKPDTIIGMLEERSY